MASGCQKRKPENTEFLLLQHKASPLLWPLVGELLGQPVVWLSKPTPTSKQAHSTILARRDY
jgi:hypothetical protein